MTARTTPKPTGKNNSFSKEELLGIFYGASLGGGTLTGLAAYGVTYLKDIETQCAISLSTATGAAGSALVTLGTIALFCAIRPKAEDYSKDKNFQIDTKEHRHRFAYAATGALLGLTEMGLIAGYTHMDGDIVHKTQPPTPTIAPPTIVQNNSNNLNTGLTHYHTDNGFILSIA